MADQKHKCGQCEVEFASYADYVAHVCPVDGHTPVEPESMGANHAAISAAAIARGEAKKAEPTV